MSRYVEDANFRTKIIWNDEGQLTTIISPTRDRRNPILRRNILLICQELQCGAVFRQRN